MTMDEYESFLNVCMTPNSTTKTDEQAEMISQLGRPSKLQPEEPTPPLKNAKYSSSLQSLNNGKGSKSSNCAGGGVTVVNSSSSNNHGNSSSKISGSGHHSSSSSNNMSVIPNVTTNCTNSICKGAESCCTVVVPNYAPLVRDHQQQQSQLHESQRNQNSHCSSNTNSSNNNNNSVSTLNNSTIINNNNNDCTGGNTNNVTDSCNVHSTTNSLQNSHNCHGHEAHHQDVIQVERNCNTNLLFTTTRVKSDNGPVSINDRFSNHDNAIVMKVPSIENSSISKLTTETTITSDFNVSNPSSRCSTPPPEAILGLPSVFSPISLAASARNIENISSSSSLNNIKSFHQQPSCDECNYTLPYYFNGRDENDIEGKALFVDAIPTDSEPRPSTSSGTYVSAPASSYATVTEFVNQVSVPYTHYGINRGLQNSLYRNPQYIHDDGLDKHGPGSQISKSSSCKDLNSSLDSGRSLTPTQYTLRSLDAPSSAPLVTGRRYGDREGGKRPNRKDKVKAVTTTSDQIQGHRGGEDIEHLVKFIEGEQATQIKKVRAPKKEREQRSKSKEKEVLVKSVSLDDDNLTAVNVKSCLERSSSSAVVEKDSSESKDAKATTNEVVSEPKPESLPSHQESLPTSKTQQPAAPKGRESDAASKPQVNSAAKPNSSANSKPHSSATIKPQANSSVKTVQSQTAVKPPAQAVVKPQPKGAAIKDQPTEKVSANNNLLAEISEPASVEELNAGLQQISLTNKEEYIVVSRKKKKKVEPKENKQRKYKENPRNRQDRNRGRGSWSNTVDRRKSVGSVPGSERGSGSDDDSVRSLPSVNVSHKTSPPDNKQATAVEDPQPSTSVSVNPKSTAGIVSPSIAKVSVSKVSAPVSDSKDSAPVLGSKDSAPVSDSKDSAPVSYSKDSAPVLGSKDSEPVSGSKDSAPVSDSKDSTPVSGPELEPPTKATIVPASEVAKPDVPCRKASTVSNNSVTTCNKPVIFCGQNFKKQPVTTINPDIEFGFGVTDFIDTAKPQETKVVESKSASESPALREEASTQVNFDSVTEAESDVGEGERISDSPKTVPSTPQGLPVYQPLTIHPNMSQCAPVPSTHYTPASMHYYPPSQQFHHSIYALPQSLMQQTQVLNQLNQLNINQQQHGYVPMPHQQPSPGVGTGVASPPVVPMNLMSPQMQNPGQNYQNVPVTVFPHMSGIQHMNMQPNAYGVNNSYINPLLLQHHQQLQQQQHQLQQQQQQLQQQQLQHQQQQYQHQIALEQQQQRFQRTSPSLHPDMLTPQQLQQAQQAATARLPQPIFVQGRGFTPNPPPPTPTQYQTQMPPYAYKHPESGQPSPGDRSSALDRDQRNRGGIANRRGSRTYYNTSERDKPRHGAQTNYNYGNHQSRDSHNSSSRRGSRQSNASPVTSPQSVPSPSGEAVTILSRPAASAQVDLERSDSTETEKQYSACDEEKVEAAAAVEEGLVLTGSQLSDIYEGKEDDEESATVGAQCREYMNTCEQNLYEKEKKGLIKIHRLE